MKHLLFLPLVLAQTPMPIPPDVPAKPILPTDCDVQITTSGMMLCKQLNGFMRHAQPTPDQYTALCQCYQQTSAAEQAQGIVDGKPAPAPAPAMSVAPMKAPMSVPAPPVNKWLKAFPPAKGPHD